MYQIHNTLVFNRMGSINSICKGNIKETMEKLLRPIMRLQKDAPLINPFHNTIEPSHFTLQHISLEFLPV